MINLDCAHTISFYSLVLLLIFINIRFWVLTENRSWSDLT